MSTSPNRTALKSTSPNVSPKKPSSPQKPITAMSENKSAAQFAKGAQANNMDYHRQVLKGKLEDESNGTKYVSPSDNILSPCTQKLSALKGRQFGKMKPKSLFAQTAVKNADDGDGKKDGEGLAKE